MDKIILFAIINFIIIEIVRCEIRRDDKVQPWWMHPNYSGAVKIPKQMIDKINYNYVWNIRGSEWVNGEIKSIDEGKQERPPRVWFQTHTQIAQHSTCSNANNKQDDFQIGSLSIYRPIISERLFITLLQPTC